MLQRAVAPGSGGFVYADFRMALAGGDDPPRPPREVMADRLAPHVSTVVAGLGGRAVTTKSLRGLITRAGELEPLTFLDLDTGLVERELARMRATRRSGPSPENMLKDLGITASRIG